LTSDDLDQCSCHDTKFVVGRRDMMPVQRDTRLPCPESIRSVVQSTAGQRAADRRLDQARNEEEKADRRLWDDDRPN